MPSPSTDSETTAIEDAYKAEIQELFKILVKNLIGARNSHETDQQCLSRFTAGLNVTQRARQLALSAATPVVRTAALGRKKPKAR
jgi:hypothetical protein